jgi:hypothetical protein
MRKSAPVAAINASACGRMRPSGTGAGAVVKASGKFSHWSAFTYREPLQERNRTRLVSIALRPPAFLVWRKAVGEHNGRAVFAFADVAAQAKGLAKREPALTGEAALDDGAPED